jgi:hypothetical protein
VFTVCVHAWGWQVRHTHVEDIDISCNAVQRASSVKARDRTKARDRPGLVVCLCVCMSETTHIQTHRCIQAHGETHITRKIDTASGEQTQYFNPISWRECAATIPNKKNRSVNSNTSTHFALHTQQTRQRCGCVWRLTQTKAS